LTVEEPKQGRKTLVAVVASWLPSCLAQDVERKHPGLALAKSSRHERGSNTRGRRLLSRPPVRASGGLRGLGLHGGSLAPPTCSGSWWRGTVCCTWSGRSSEESDGGGVLGADPFGGGGLPAGGGAL